MSDSVIQKAPDEPATETETVSKNSSSIDPPDAEADNKDLCDNDYLRLRRLLLGDEYSAALNKYIAEDDDVKRVSRVLPNALALAEQKKLGESIAPVIDHAISVSIEEHPRRIVNAVFPIIGPAIRKAVASALADMVHSLNTLLEQSLTLRSVMWRFRAWQAGMPYAKYVLLQTLHYRVEQVLLVHRETGLLLNAVTAAEVEAQDPELVSSMLTAIGDFVSDSFATGNQTLERIRIGDLELELVVGPYAVLAVAIRGTATDELILAANSTIEAVHAEYSQPLINFDGDRSPFDATTQLLSNCLLSQKIENLEGKKPWLALTLLSGVCIFLVVHGYNAWSVGQQMDAIESSIRNEPGYLLISTRVHEKTLLVDLIRAPDSRATTLLIESLVKKYAVQVEIKDRIVHFGPRPEPTIQEAVTPPPSEMELLIDLVNQVQNTHFYFAPNQSKLSEAELQKIPQLIDNVKRLIHLRHSLGITDMQLMVMGFADSSGTSKKNQSISQARANTITALLQQNLESVDFLVGWGLGNLDNLNIAEKSKRRVNLQLIYSLEKADQPVPETNKIRQSQNQIGSGGTSE